MARSKLETRKVHKRETLRECRVADLLIKLAEIAKVDPEAYFELETEEEYSNPYTNEYYSVARASINYSVEEKK